MHTLRGFICGVFKWNEAQRIGSRHWSKKIEQPVFARSDQPDGKVMRQLERAGAVIRLPGDVIVLRRPADNRDEVLRRVYWPIVEALLSNYSPAVIDRDSAVRILVGDETPPPLLRLRNGPECEQLRSAAY